MKAPAFLLVSLFVLPTLAAYDAQAQPRTVPLITEEFMIPGADPGVQLYVRNKRPRDATRFTADNVVLFVHGATYPAETSFDLQLDGVSWMDYIASRGYDVYLVDVRGYGKSSRPAEMDQPAERNAPIVRTDTAARDYGAAVDFVLKRRAVAKLNVLGWSWGTAITALYTSQNNAKVNRLVLYAPVWLRETQVAHRHRRRSWRVPHGHGRSRAEAQGRRHPGGQEADARGLVRGMGARHIRERSGGRQGEPALRARAERRGAR